MKKYIPLSKQTKKQQKAFHAKQRSTWNGFNPTSRTFSDGKGYDRNKQKQEDRRSGRLSYDKDNTCRYFCVGGVPEVCRGDTLGATSPVPLAHAGFFKFEVQRSRRFRLR